MMWGPDFGFGWGGFGGLMMLVFWGGLILLGALLVRGFSGWGGGHTSGTTGGSNRAMEVLKERYARGEITKEQYEDMRRDLG